MRATQGRGVPPRLAAAFVSSLVLATLSACTEGGNGEDGEPGGVVHSGTGPSPDSSPSTSPGTGSGEGGPSTVADPDHAVETPGPFQSPLTYVDMLVSSTQAIDDAVVEKIEAFPQVDSVARLSVAQVPIEEAVYNVASVDAATYRNFTTQTSAFHQEQWDRIAGGEMAVLSSLQGKLPVDKQSYLKMGPGADAPRIHVGAYSEQVPGIDLVVNEKWGETLDMPDDNALVISTARATPQRLRKPIENLIGENASVQLTDIATLRGLDPGAFYTANLVGTYAQAVGNFTYRVDGGRVIPSQSWVDEYIVQDTVPILGTVTCNKHMMPQLKAALDEIVKQGLASKLHKDQYAGCYYPRFIAGSTKLSNHAFGLALDVNVPGNQRGTVGEIDRDIVRIFKYWGFAWGGDWNYTDPMHFELSRIVNPGG